VSLRRFGEVFRRAFTLQWRRPLIWILLLILALMAYGLVSGNVTIRTGDSDTAGKKAWITSQFAMARWLCAIAALAYSFFVAVAAGMPVIQDDEDKVGAILHATPLTTREYVWGKWLAVVATFLGVLALELGFHAVSAHLLAGPEKHEYIGPFVLANYLRPALLLVLPLIVAIAGASFLLGTWTRKAIPVFFLPAALLLFCLFFLWQWNPSWLQADHPGIERLLQWIDPSGLRWLGHVWLDVDRGVDFYNHGTMAVDPAFGASRAALVLLGLLCVHVAERRFARTLRGAVARRSKAEAARAAEADAAERAPAAAAATAAGATTTRRPGLFRGALEIARAEARELRSQPGLYLFVPLILLQTIGVGMTRVGPFDTPLLATAGTLAAQACNTLMLLLCLLLLFYTVESLEREKARGLAPIHHATPVGSGSLLLGKSLANSVVAFVILVAAWLASVVILLIQGKAPLQTGPFAIVWGLLLLPSFFTWTAFVAALHALSRNRYATYGLALGVLVLCGWLTARDATTWVTNWNLWGVVTWSDLGPLELDRGVLILNRLLWIAWGIAFTAFAVKLFPRRSLDPASVLLALRPLALLKSLLRFSPFLAAPIVLSFVVGHLVDHGRGGDAAEKRGKDYWRKNVATWKDAKKPTLVDVELDLTLDPERSTFQAKGRYGLKNLEASPLPKIAITPGFHFEHAEWSLAGEKSEPEDRAGLLVFTPKAPLAPGAALDLGFAYDGRFPAGASKNGGALGQFILPSGAVLTSFGPEFVPAVGFLEGVGIDKDNKADAKVWPDDWYVGVTKSGFGNDAACTTHVTLHVPEAYTANSVGVLESESVENGVRTAVWRSDYPVEFFNVICGKWAVKRGEGTALYYWPGHSWNVDEMVEALDGARRWYSEWFMPFPWKELKLSEFADHSTYAQGFPTDITFSEGIGFLAKSDPRARVAFMVTAHESAHQWWGNLLVPGEGPGGNLLSEGMAHFSTILLFQQMRGERERIEFLKRIETSYNRQRQVDSEKPLVKIDGSRAGDTTVTYDKGGWVFWMLLNQMGRERCLAGLQEFLRRYHHQRDHAVLQDFVATLREFADDPAAYDAFTKQWFFEVVVPEYRLSEAKKQKLEAAASSDHAEEWEVTARVENAGTGTMPLEVAAARGERFPDDESPAKDDAAVAAAKAAPGKRYADARTTVTLHAGESATVTIRCPFEPERLLVDPDLRVLQLRREQATVKL
jgi:ABC-2 type transport system permease protein